MDRKTEEYIIRFKQRHGDKYDYSLIKKIEKRDQEILVICKGHGIFKHTAIKHTAYGCIKCSGKWKRTTEEIIKEFKEVHGERYDYSKVKYERDGKKVEIICRKHGSFFMQPGSHKRDKQNCLKCYRETAGEKKRITQEFFLKKVKEYFKNLYDFSKSIYLGANEKIIVFCKKHGDFKKDGRSLLAGIGCPKCSKETNKNPRQDTTKSFISKAIKKHGNLYDYSLVDYKIGSKEVKVICKIHGEFLQKPGYHLSGCGCQKCKSSHGEMSILKWLTEKKMNFIHQYKIQKFEGKNQVFDFFVPEKNLVIEYHGIQHYYIIKYWGAEKGYIEGKRQDLRKITYCKNNSINLLIIPYTELKNIDKILDKEIELI